VRVPIFDTQCMSINIRDINSYFTAAILKIQNSIGLCANVNIIFRIPDVISCSKMY